MVFQNAEDGQLFFSSPSDNAQKMGFPLTVHFPMLFFLGCFPLFIPGFHQ